MKRIVSLYFGLVRILLAALLVGMVVLVFGNVALRYAFNSGLVISEELSRIFFVWIVFLGAALAMAEHGHIGIDTVIKRVPPRVARLMTAISCLLIVACAGLLLKGSYIQSEINLEVVTPALNMPMTIFYAAGVFFGLAAIIIAVLDLWRTVFARTEAVVLVQRGSDGGDAAEAAAREPGAGDDGVRGRAPR